MTSRPQRHTTAIPVDVDALIVDGLQAHRDGRLSVASDLYARALKLRPDHADALNLAGACAFAQGQTEAAIRLISRAVAALPTHFDAYINLAEAQRGAGRVRDAVDTCRKALAGKPDFVDAHARLSVLLNETGAFDQALAHANVALALDPETVEALCGKGVALLRLQRFVEADAAYARGVDLAPENLSALTGWAALLALNDQIDEAAALYRRAADVAPGNASVIAALGSAVERGGDTLAAVSIFDRALALSPGSADFEQRRAAALRDTGEFAAAEAGLRRSLAADPNFAPAILSLVRMKRFDLDAAEGKRLARLIADKAQPLIHRVQAGFALAELLDQAGDPDEAFRRFTEANGLQAKAHAERGERFDAEGLRGMVEQTEANLAREYSQQTADWGDPTEQPVFVVGLPRSGTSLVEQICASHSQVVGAGELTAVLNAARRIVAANVGRERLADWDPAIVRAESARHARVLEGLGAGARRVIDKTPLNVMRLGLIGAMFPKARVIWCHRDPRDVVVSNHTLYFARGNTYSTDQRNYAYAVRQIERMGAAWERHSPLPILNVTYENLVADSDNQVRTIIEFLGLAWEPACLEFHKTDRRVGTPSSWQVRQPIYSSSIGRWRRYEKHLEPMIEALTEAL
jgi:tetratricopeptide (TPR) repeat protein